MRWSVDVSGPVLALGTLAKRLPGATESALRSQADAIQSRARTVHRYKNRTGNLGAATLAEATANDITGYIDESKAHYGKFVHDGQRSWAPDPFVYEAMGNQEHAIAVAVERAIDSAIINAGLS